MSYCAENALEEILNVGIHVYAIQGSQFGRKLGCLTRSWKEATHHFIVILINTRKYNEGVFFLFRIYTRHNSAFNMR